jgi:predicted MFS family arabinose efflux permease
VSLPLRERLGALQERDFRLLFTATTITTLGDAIAGIALTFAVLITLHGSPKELGVVLAVRIVASSSVVLGGGALSDRLPRHLVIVGASLVQGFAQVATATLLLSGQATILALAILQLLYGLGSGLVLPAEVGLIPQTVSSERLQQANALQGLTRNVVFVLGPPIGGALVVAGNPGIALGVDAASFFVAALVMARIRIPRRPAEPTAGYLHELREGWREFSSRTWLWSTVIVFGVGNIFFMFWSVLGPTVLRDQPLSWSLVTAAGAVGAIVGGVVAIRYRPRRPLVACVVVPIPFAFRLIALALDAPVWFVALASFCGGVGIAVHLALWFTVFQREVPEHAQSRVSAYDTLGSFVLTPIGTVIAAPVAALVGIDEALLIAAGAIVALNLGMLLIPSVWAIRRRERATTMAAV